MRAMYHALMCAIGYAAIVLLGLFLRFIDVYRPENIVLCLLALWTAYQVMCLLLFLRRYTR